MSNQHPSYHSGHRDGVHPDKRRSRKGGLMGFGLTAAALYVMFKPGLNLFHIALLGGAAYLVGQVCAIIGGGLDTTTHNKQDQVRRELDSLGITGDQNADAIITQGQEMIRRIRQENDAIPDRTLTEQMYHLENLCVQIFRTVAEKPAKAGQIRKFMNYYLPTTLKMLANYRTMQNRGVSASDLAEARKTVIRGMNMVLTACQKQLDNLYKDDMLDISTDIDVLEQMLRRDGFVQGDLANAAQQAAEAQQAIAREQAAQPVQVQPAQPQQPQLQVPAQPRTAAAAQMGTGVHPTLHVDADGDGQDDFQSFYQRR